MERLKNNWQWKLISIIIGFFLWSYVTAGVNPTQRLTLRDVPIEIRNQEQLNEEDYVITRIEPTSVSLTLSGKRNTLGALNDTDLLATIDFSAFDEGANVKQIRFETPTGVIVDDATSRTVNVYIEKNITRQVPIQITENGQLQDNYILESVVATPQSVEVSGPRSIVDSISYLQAIIDITDLTEDRSSNVKIVPINGNGEEVTGVTMGLSSANISVSVLKQKEVSIESNIQGEFDPTKRLERVSINPTSILVKGKADIIDSLETIHTEPIDANTISENMQLDVEIAFPDGVEAVDDTNTVNINIDIESQESQTIEFPFNRFSMENTPSNFNVRINNPNATMEIVLTGFPSDFETFTAEAIQGKIDLAGANENLKSVVPSFTTPDGISVTSTDPRSVPITVSKPNQQSSESQTSGGN